MPKGPLSTASSLKEIMRKPLNVSFWSVRDLFPQLEPHQYGRKFFTDKLDDSRCIATSSAHGFAEYGVESTPNSIKKKIVHALCLGERGRASTLLLDFCHGNHSLRPDDFYSILTYCARSPDPLFVMETWRVMVEKEIGLNSRCLILMLEALCKGGYIEQAFNMITSIGESYGIYPMLPVYNCLLRACLGMRSVIHVNKCLDLMEHRMVGKNEVTYFELLKLAVWQRNLSAVHEIWEDYFKHYSPSIISLQKFIWSYSRLTDLKSAYETLQQMVRLVFQGNIFTSIIAEGRLQSLRLDIPVLSVGKLVDQKFDPKENESSTNLQSPSDSQRTIVLDMGKREVESFGKVGMTKLMDRPTMKILGLCFSNVMNACAKAQNCGLAEQLMLQMQNLGLQPSSHTYNGFIRAIISERGFSEGMEVLKIMQQRNLKPCDSTLAALAKHCSKALELDLAEALLDQIFNCRYPYPYNAFLEACDRMDQPERAVQMLGKMGQLKLQLDIRTYELLFSLFGSVNAPYEEGNTLSHVESIKRINAIEMAMANNGVQHSHLSMKNLLRALGMEGMTRELLQYLRAAEELFCRTNTYLGTPIYNIVLHSLIEAKESHLAIKIFKNMISSGSRPNVATYTVMIDCCSIIQCYKSACALLSAMMRQGYFPGTLTYTAFMEGKFVYSGLELLVLLECGKFDEALDLLDKVHCEELQLDVLLYNTILKKAFLKGRIDVLELIVEQMHRDRVQPDPGTCRRVFTAYVESGFHNTAIEALQVLSMRMICQDDSSFHEMKAEYENEFILSEVSKTEAQILQSFGGIEEKTTVALLYLRWCAILGFPNSWSPNQAAWARRLATDYEKRKRS